MISKDTYIEERLDRQIEWYSKKGSIAKITYILLSVIILILTSFIPILTSVCDTSNWLIKVIIGGFGAVSAILTGTLNIIKCKENWIKYRQVSESLKREKTLYCTKSKGYREADALDKLIEKCEEFMKLENDAWVNGNNVNKKI